MLLLPIQMYGQQQGYGTADSNKILSEFGKSAYKMMMDANNPMAKTTGAMTPQTPITTQPMPVTPDAFDVNPLGFDKDPSGQFYIDNTGAPIDRDTYNYIIQDINRQQADALKNAVPDNYNIGGILDYLQFYKR